MAFIECFLDYGKIKVELPRNDVFTYLLCISKESVFRYILTLVASQLSIRLAGIGSNSSQGRVEVNYNGNGWGTICDDLWSISDGDVACRMLGFRAALDVERSAFYGTGSAIIWLDDVICQGNEASLLDCSHSGLRVHNCRHSEDAGVVCTSTYIIISDYWNYTY